VQEGAVLRNYLKLSLKVLARRKFFTFVSLFGIGFTLAVLVFASALVDHTLAPQAPESRQDRMLVNFRAFMYKDAGSGGNQWSSNGGYLLFDRYGRGLPGVEHLSIFSSGSSVASFLHGQKIVSSLKRTDGAYWQVLDFTFLEGGPFTERDVEAGRTVAVINETTRRRFFGGAPAVGRQIEADGQRFTVIGVVPDVSTMRQVPFADIWVPLTTAKSDTYRRELMGGFNAVVLATDRSWLPRIRDEFNARLQGVEFPDPRNYDTIVAPLEGKLDAYSRELQLANRRDPSPQGWRLAAALTVVAVLFAILPIVNLINLNVSRIMERASEIGVRKAFGASGRVLVGQFVVENVVLTAIGGVIALVVAAILLRTMNASGVLPYTELAINWRTFAYGLGLALVFGVVSGVYPAWRMSRLHPAEALKGGAR
jgi:putative ABC transport system permease protein